VCVFLRGGGAAVQKGLATQEGVRACQLPSRIARQGDVAAQVAAFQKESPEQVAAHSRAFTSGVWHLELRVAFCSRAGVANRRA
jgi:hypothetical protein